MKAETAPQRNKKGGNIKATFYLPITTHEKMRTLAAMNSRSGSNYMTILINREFARMEEEKN